MLIEETFSYKYYEVTLDYPSRIAPHETVRRLIGVACPRCNRVFETSVIRNGVPMACQCGVTMTKAGNDLQCSMEEELADAVTSDHPDSATVLTPQ